MSHNKFSNIWNIYNHYSIIIFQSVIPTRLIKQDATAYFQCAKDDVKTYEQHTRTCYFAEKYMFYAEIRPGCKVCELRYRPIYTRIQFIIPNTKEECYF